MKEVLEEYGMVLLAVMVGGILVGFLVWGLQESGFLEVMARTFSKMTFGG